jgi:hypothetical protein
MATYAMMSGNTVSNVIMADDKEATEAALNCNLIEYTPENPAGIGYTYDEVRDAFIPPKPFDSWVLDEETCQWKAPIVYPTNGKIYLWNENHKEWEESGI